MPALARGLRHTDALLRKGNREAAAALVDQLITAFPTAATLRTIRADLADPPEPAESGQALSRAAKALAAFAAPIPTPCPPSARGMSSPSRAQESGAAVVRAQLAPVGADNTAWDSGVQRLRARFVFPQILALRPLARRQAQGGQRSALTPVQDQLQEWYVQGTASGLSGVLYDNRDGGHSLMRTESWPQLAATEYSDAARAAGVDYGLNTQILFNAITIGNSSTAFTSGPHWRSQPRLALTSPEGAERLYQLYANNHIYVFPENRDHDPASTGGLGDVLPANTPYLLISQGSSGSDRPFLDALASIIAAFPPETTVVLRRHGLVAPSVQMVFRRGLKGVSDRDTYMSAAAHPSVFRAEDIDVARMIGLANGLSSGFVPPMPCLEVVRESQSIPRIAYHADGLPERFFDTPSAIARVWRSVAPTRSMTVSAAATRDPNGRPLTFHWRVLRGEADRIAITPSDAAAATVELSIGWHERRPVPGRPELTTDRIDIAVFADNGRELSAPAFISIVFPADQLREFQVLPDGSRRIASVDYADAERRKRYVDPRLFVRRDWRDQYRYDASGNLTGWTRTQKGAADHAFTRFGHRVIATDSSGRPTRAEEIAYPSRPDKRGTFAIEPKPTGRTFAYTYASPDDRLGRPRPESSPETQD